MLRDRFGLPYLPGRHIKGLLRHAFLLLRSQDHLGDVGSEAGEEADVVARLFGRGAGPIASHADPNSAARTRFGTTEALLRFGSARLPNAWSAYAQTEPGVEATKQLVRLLNTTAIGEKEVVRARTLRSIEIAVPMKLAATVTAGRALRDDELRWVQTACGLVRRVGRHRTRGLGRATITFGPEVTS